MFGELKQKIIKGFRNEITQPIEKSKSEDSELHDTAYVDSSLFDWTKDLEANQVFIRREITPILNHLDHISDIQQRSAGKQLVTLENKGEVYFLYGSGYKAELNCARCPITTQLIEKIPGMTDAYLSFLGPGKRIPEKKGNFKGLVRYRMGVKVTSSDKQCGINVAGQKRYLMEGVSLAFDNTYPYEVWNNSSQIVVVLSIDVLHPPSLVDTVGYGLSERPFYKKAAKRNQEIWKDRYQAQTSTTS